jgi:hypothetical protein
MKKGLIIIVAALFVAAMALPAMAVDMSLSGFYRVRGIYQSNANQGQVMPWDGNTPYTTNGYGSPDAYWDHLLRLNPVFKVADNLKLITRVSVFNNQMWGSSETSGGVPTAGIGHNNWANFGDTADNIILNQAYIEWTGSWGKLHVGRKPGIYTYFTEWANTEMDVEKIHYFSPSWGPFSFFAFHEKWEEQSVTSGNNMADEDLDRYSLCLQYTKPCLYLGYAFDYYHVRTGSESPATTGWKANRIGNYFCVQANDSTNTYFFKGELALLSGDYKDYYAAGTTDVDRAGWGYYAKAWANKGPLTVGVGMAYTSGDDNASDGDYDVGPASGGDFQPMYVLYGPQSNILNTTLVHPSQKSGYSNAGQFGNPGDTATGSVGYWIYADYTVDPQLALHGALGIAYADKISSTYYQDDEFGKELDLGLKYQIMSNLAYELHLGYLWTGDFFKGPAGTNYTTDDVYQIDHSLTLSF